MKFGLLAFAAALAAATPLHALAAPAPSVRAIVDRAVQPLMVKDAIPGLAVGVTVNGKTYVFNYGVASLRTRRPVTGGTLFELGSVSKTFTATLASWEHVQHRLSLTDTVSAYVPALRGSAFGNVTLLNLGTHTPGGIPLQVPDGVTTDAQLMAYLRQWRPSHAAGTYRTYSNIGIGMLGFITAKAAGKPFETLMEQRLFPALGLRDTYLDVPAARMAAYAWGYRNGKPVRMSPGELSQEAYGVRTTASDMTRFVEENLGEVRLDGTLQRAIAQTHTGYFTSGPLTQDLIWEQYGYPVSLDTLLAGNSAKMLFEGQPARAISPPEAPQSAALLDKTGSTNGFGSYVAFIPAKRLGIVILANKNYPITDRVRTAYAILNSLEIFRH